MQTELKDAIIEKVQDNTAEYQLTNFITNHFRVYIYDTDGNYLIGGEQVSKFIDDFINLYTK